ncbi:16S rRNA (guanine(966)-N(2))-methyltransferase RsmD [Bifidobacterium sp. 64T4]|uniref:16S rRNA (guanine(966)-N(2))-methyltransferase RsmD n=1 Tax=Bifidobacterium pongonis TaxID=2834432 RepID=UPI001C59F309|nr:16S rRNA (guanine(966)-N(2))-methyltransferase RsmD [Bifidobacterium pongonis]MBW3094475.1 16S rRNA (guanine(966)-N(2))-methyltransferase RsmD [Bifidobacterium pongonis]
MRVISGRFKGVALATPKQGTRPTTDRTKEAIFSHLDSWGVLDDARVLDLFAGTGALGIEALSRGARELVAVEASKPAAALVAGTLKQLKRNRSWSADLRARVLVRKAEALAAATADAPYDVVFIDPPYAFETEACNQLLADLVANGWVDAHGVIMLERSARSDEPTAPEGWEITQSRSYGETAVFYIESAQESTE